ncbi:MAG: RNA polymerase sigma factor, partial [Actinobacteria bacterium]|nr:RNA polymerase sigma factor [Actinomycetota bacterium]
MSEELDDVVLPPVEVDPVFVTAVEDAMSGVPAQVPDPNRALGADPHDFAGLYIRHRSSFAAHARRFLRDPRDVDEVVQEAFLRLFLALPELSTELQALAYCRRTVTNLCIDRYRADKRRPRLVNIETLPPNDFPDDEADDPVVRAEDAAFVREALSLLSPLHRDALVKREIEEKSLPVIAQELGIPEESVKHLLHRARRALRRHLAKTHLAPGADLESVSTMTLLAKSAAAGGGRLGVVLVFTLAVLVGAKPELPATALMSWPIQDL